jgi:DNA-binding transcriptional ArsR family regulator
MRLRHLLYHEHRTSYKAVCWLQEVDHVRSSRQRPDLVHPAAETLDLLDVLHALADPTRMTIVATLVSAPERACGTFPVEVAASTLSHHFRVLREAGVIHQRDEGNRRWTSLRAADLEKRFPGVFDTIVAAWHQQQSQFALASAGTPGAAGSPV